MQHELTGGHGADLIYDPVGGTPARESLGGIANEGRLLAVGFASGETTHPSSRDVLRPNCSIVGVYTGHAGGIAKKWVDGEKSFFVGDADTILGFNPANGMSSDFFSGSWTKSGASYSGDCTTYPKPSAAVSSPNTCGTKCRTS